MTVSGTDSFNMTLTEIVEKAFHILGKAEEGEAMTPRMYSDGKSSLNLLIKTWGAQTHLWTLAEGSVTMVASQAAYVITPKPMRIIDVRRRQAGIDVPLSEMSRQEYFDQPTKTTSPSTPVSFYYDPQRSTGTLYLWPAPSSAIIGTITLNMTYLRRMDDMVSTNDDADMPQEWLQALVWNLANELETEYPVNDSRLAQKIERKAAQLFDSLKGWDTEPASLFMQPDLMWNG